MTKSTSDAAHYKETNIIQCYFRNVYFRNVYFSNVYFSRVYYVAHFMQGYAVLHSPGLLLYQIRNLMVYNLPATVEIRLNRSQNHHNNVQEPTRRFI